MKNKVLLAAFAILYQVSQSNSWVNEQLESFQNPQNLEKPSYKETHDKYGEISIKKEGGLKKIISFSNKSNEATIKKFNAKKQKLHELRRLRKSRSNETSDSSNKDIIKLRKFTSDFDSKYTAKSRSDENKTSENIEENNSKIKSKEEFYDTNSSHESMFHSQPISLSRDYPEFNQEINSSSGDQNLRKGYRDRKQNQFRHLWGQDRSIHSYRSASMHKKTFWYSPYHFPRAKVTVAGLNIPWFRLRSTSTDEDIQISKPVQHNNHSNLSTTRAPIEMLVTNISNIAEQSITPVNRIDLPSQTPLTLQPRQPHWPNFYRNVDHHTSEKSLKVYKSVRVANKAESVEAEKTTVHSETQAGIAASVSQKTTQVHFNENYKHVNSRQQENETAAGNTSRISNPGGKDVKVTTVDDVRSTYINLQNVTPRVLTTTLKPIREPQWPPWPQWLNEPLQKHNNVYNGSYVLNEYTANIYSNNEKSVTLRSVKLNDATETTKKTDGSELFFDIASTYNGLTENIAALLPVTTGITAVATTETNNNNDNIDEKSHYSDINSGTILPNLRNIVRCSQGCPLTPEFNPVCGTDDITYTNPGRLLCLQFCGLDVKVKKYQPCSSRHKLSEYPNMINLFINTAVESLRATVTANASAPGATISATALTPRATVKASTSSPTNSTTVFYVRYDSFSLNDEDEDVTEARAVYETATEMASRNKQLTETTVVTSAPMSAKKYIEKVKDLIDLNTEYNKHHDSQSTTTDGSSQVKDVKHSIKKIKSNLAALNNMLKHTGRDVSTKGLHPVTYSSRDVATKRFAVTRAIKDVSTKNIKMIIPTNSRKNSNSKNNLIHKQHTPRVDALDSGEEPNNNGRRFVESPFVDLPYSSGEYISPDENTVDIFQDNQKDSDDPADDVDSKFWAYQSEKEKHDVIEDDKVKEKTH